MSDWSEAKARLADAVAGVTTDEYFVEVQPADIRAALGRVEELERSLKFAMDTYGQGWRERAEAAEAKLADMMAQRDAGTLDLLAENERHAETAHKLAVAEAQHPNGTCLEPILRSERDKARRDLDCKDHECASLQSDVERLTGERDDLQEHERQTHERLGAILGTDDSLEECAKRMRRERDEARDKAKKYHDALVARHGGEPVALLGELDDSKSEVSRLEGLILDWESADLALRSHSETALYREARRIRAQREEGER